MRACQYSPMTRYDCRPTVARAAAGADDQELRLVLAIVGADVVMLDAVEEIARGVLRSVVKYPLIWL